MTAILRLHVTKGEPVRYLSHLDYMRAWERALRRSGLPVAYSGGFNPHIKLAFAAPLAVGVTSEAEYVDIPLAQEVPVGKVLTALAAALPPGIAARGGDYAAAGAPSLTASVTGAAYLVTAPLTSDAADGAAAVARAVASFLAAAQAVFTKDTPKGQRQVDARRLVTRLAGEVAAGQVTLHMDVLITPAGSVKAAEVLALLATRFDLPVLPTAALIQRTALYTREHGRMRPL